MDPNKNFTEEDKAQLVKFLNAVAKHAKFEVDTGELLEYARLLSFMQKIVLPKVDNHILEFKRVIEAEKETTSDSETE